MNRSDKPSITVSRGKSRPLAEGVQVFEVSPSPRPSPASGRGRFLFFLNLTAWGQPALCLKPSTKAHYHELAFGMDVSSALKTFVCLYKDRTQPVRRLSRHLCSINCYKSGWNVAHPSPREDTEQTASKNIRP
jgi:hypothetical protein